MARSSSKAVALATGGSKSIALLDAELANEVALLKNQIGTPSGNRIKVEATGDFILPDGQNLGDEIQVVIVDFVSRNTFYSTPFDRDNPSPPDCYAIGRDLMTLAPESDSPAIQATACRVCPLNLFGSGNNGKSKACKNSRVLAVLVIDPDNSNALDNPLAPIYTLELPPTAIRSFDGTAAYVARTLAGPPVKAILTVRAKNVGTYALIAFSDPLPNPAYAAHFARRADCQDMLFRKPDFSAYEAKQPPRNRKVVPARRVANVRR